MRAKAVKNGDTHYGISFECPGCNETHSLPTLPYPRGWTFNGDYDFPTLTPSVLVFERKVFGQGGRIKVAPRCHSFVTKGRIEFLADSTHALRGQTVDLPKIAP